MNASGELSRIPASLVLAPVLRVAIPNNPDRMADDALRLLPMAPGATAAVVAVSLRTRPEDFDHLRAFYRHVHPLGFWGPVTSGAVLPSVIGDRLIPGWNSYMRGAGRPLVGRRAVGTRVEAGGRPPHPRASVRTGAEGPMSRYLILLIAGCVAPSACGAGAVAAASPAAVREENAKPGADDWQLTRVRLDKQDATRCSLIEGYCSKQSVKAGEALDIFVSTNPPARFEIEVFRTGYYGGKGARLMTTLGPFQGETQPTPAPGKKNLHECRWKPTTRLTVPADWLSGVYLGRLTTLPDSPEAPYWQSYVIFVVRDDRPADVLFQCSDNTWQAYNKWPTTFSLYTHPKGGQGPWADVSFDRPYGRQAQYTGIVNDPLSVGSGEFLSFERPLSYFLERHGYDVTYCSNSDLLTPDRGRKCKAFVSVGHDEYWDIRQYRSVTAMRDAGVSLLFLSGNSVCWVTPFRPGHDGRPNRIIFRGGPYGGDQEYARERAEKHGPFPERGPDEGLLMGARNTRPINGGGDWTVTRPEHWVFEGTGMKKGDRVPGLVGWEYHGGPADLPGLEVVAAGHAWVGGTTLSHWAATVYPGPKNNFVFNAATIFWCQGLSAPPGHTLPWSHWSRPHGPDARVQRITHNLLTKAGCRRATPAGN